MCRVRRSASLSQAVADGGRAGQAVGTARVTAGQSISVAVCLPAVSWGWQLSSRIVSYAADYPALSFSRIKRRTDANGIMPAVILDPLRDGERRGRGEHNTSDKYLHQRQISSRVAGSWTHLLPQSPHFRISFHRSSAVKPPRMLWIGAKLAANYITPRNPKVTPAAIMMIGIAMFHQLGSGTVVHSGCRSSWFAKGITTNSRATTPSRRRCSV